MITINNKNLDIKAIADSGQCFRWETDGNNNDGNVSYRVVAFKKLLHMTQIAGSDEIVLDCDTNEYDLIWKEYLDLNTDYAKIIRNIPEDDTYLKNAAKSGGGIRILRQDPWEVIISFIISQRKNIPAIMSSVKNLSEAAGTFIKEENGEKIYAFPDPDELSTLSMEELDACSLGYRSKYIYGAAKLFSEDKELINKMTLMPDEELYEKLTDIYGIGRKVANCVMLFGFHRLDSFPMDVWMNRIEERYYKGGIPKEKYRPYGGIMQQYMFAYERSKD